MPAARAVHSSGTVMSNTGLLAELQFKALRAAKGIIHNSEKLAKSTFPFVPRISNKKAYTKSGTSTGTLTMSVKPKKKREYPKPPGLMK